ncbi:MAG: MotA/TolQ/ExbB proton channel family protein [Oscillospiraceae bacterium]|jgi:chemotaxis protein MotA|nr:MotA/TolQ/ExbB proton channel family protein [Oscillospiraceae bacterium]
MNLSFIIGLVVGTVLVVFGIVFDGNTFQVVFGNIGNFFDPTSILVTVGGTLGAMIASFPLNYFAKIPAHFGIVLGRQKQDPLYYINVMTDLSQEARKKGLLALEDSVSEFEDTFLRDSVMLIVDAMEPDKVRDQLDNELSNIENRHSQVWNLYDKGAALAPGFGMIGTLIGLVNMLKSMDFEDEGGASALAQNMSVALITTFYGSIMANLIFIPFGNQLRLAHDQEMLCKEIIIEGIISIQAGENPRHIHEKLLSYLTYRQREQAGTGESE